MLEGALFGILEEASHNILILTEDIEQDDFFASRLTQQEVFRQLSRMAETCANVPVDIKDKMAEIDWAGWNALNSQLKVMGGFEQDTVWFGIRSLVPATLMWLRVYKQSQPEIFSYKP